MEHVVVDRYSTGSGDAVFHRRTTGGSCRRLPSASSPAMLARANSFHLTSAPPFPYVTYNLPSLYTCNSLHSLPSHHPALLLRLPPVTMPVHGTFLHRPCPFHRPVAATPRLTVPAAVAPLPRMAGDYKRKKPRTPRSAEESPRAQRRKPLQRAVPLPAATAITAALDDLERELPLGFVEDLLHALAPPPSSLPLPTFSLVRAAAAKAVEPCTV